MSSLVAWRDAENGSGAYDDYVAARPMKIRYLEDRVADIGDRVRPGRLLDVGCACVDFLEVTASRGSDLQGVEFSRSAIAAASPSVRPPVLERTLESMRINGLFDVASAFDLIEHVRDLRDFLRRCACL